MKDSKDIKKEIALKNKEKALLEKELAKSELGKRIQHVPDIILKNKLLSEKLTSLPCDEARIVWEEVINSEQFLKIFDTALCTSTRLSGLRASKAKKKEKRKATEAEELRQPESAECSSFEEHLKTLEIYDEDEVQGEVLQRYSQAEMSEQNF